MNFRIVHFLVLLFCSIFKIAKIVTIILFFCFIIKIVMVLYQLLCFYKLLQKRSFLLIQFAVNIISTSHCHFFSPRFTYLVCSYVPYILMLVNFCFTLLSHRCLISRKTDKKNRNDSKSRQHKKKKKQRKHVLISKIRTYGKKNVALYKAAKN